MPGFGLPEDVNYFTLSVRKRSKLSTTELGSEEIKVGVDHGIQGGELGFNENRLTFFVCFDLFIVALSTRRVATVDVVELSEPSVVHTEDALVRDPVRTKHCVISLKHSATMLHHELKIKRNVHWTGSRSRKFPHVGTPGWHRDEIVVRSAT